MPPAERSPGVKDEEVRSRIRKLESQAGRGLWALVLFTAVSLWAQTGFRYVPDLPPAWRDALGSPPPPWMVSALFVVYVFSALILGMARLAEGKAAFSGYRHVGYLTAFYVFYHVAGVLEDNFWAVFIGGFVVLGLEAYGNWTACRHLIRLERAKLPQRREPPDT